YDDNLYVAANPQVAHFASAARAFVTAYPESAPQLGLYRPLTVVSYALNAAITGASPWGFHLFNVLLHVLVVLTVFGLARRLFGGAALPAFIAALLFAVHAVHVEAVAWIVGRAEVLATLFALLSFRAYVAYREGGGGTALALSALAYGAALLSKETAA